MESKKSIGKRVEEILVGRGFYIVMLLCAVIIGVSIWSLFKAPSEIMPDESEFDEVLSEVTPVEYEPDEPVADEADESFSAEEEAFQQTATELTEVWPVEGEIQRDYSMDALQYDPTMSDWRTHDGLDIAAEIGTTVLAIRSGTVQSVYADDLYGTTVVIDHGDGLVICYANLEQVPTVYEGDTVAAGDVIGSVGDTAKCESAQSGHLHLSIKMNGESVSPLDHLPKKT